MKFSAYTQYKNSGIEWLGDIPAHWEVKKLKYLCKIQTGDKDTVNAINDGEYPFFVRSQTIERINSFTFNCEAVLTAGDGAGVGKVFHYINGKFDFHQRVYAMYNFNGVFGRYFYYYLREMFHKVALDGSAKSTVDSLRLPMFLNFPITLSNISEQTAIANFLDRETHRIDNLIQEKERFIELLKEKRQALISHCVTKGLNPAVKMKASGIEWLGDIPEHWKVKKIKHIFEIRKRIAGKEGYPVLSITQTGIKVKDIISGEGQLSMDYSKYQIVNIGDFAMNHMDLLTGFVDISKFYGVTSPDYRVFSLIDSNSMDKYYLYLMQMGYTNKIFYSLGQGVATVGRWRFQTEPFNNFEIPYPNKQEQTAIANYLDNQTAKIDALISETKKSISLLKEHRAALISSAITGKIKII